MENSWETDLQTQLCTQENQRADLLAIVIVRLYCAPVEIANQFGDWFREKSGCKLRGKLGMDVTEISSRKTPIGHRWIIPKLE